MSRPLAWLALVAATVLSGCGGEESGGGPGAGGAGGSAGSGAGGPTGHVRLRFTLGGSAATSRNLVDEKVGPVYSSIYDRDDVTLTGPREGAVPAVEGVYVPVLDLRTADVSDFLWEGDMAAGDYVWLGFWDVDDSSAADAAATPGPENGDPVPLADTNPFTVTAGTTTDVTVAFDLIYAFD